MTRDATARARVRPTPLGIVAVLFASLFAVVGPAATAGAVSPPTLTITPEGPYHNGQKISLSVGPNRFFKPYFAHQHHRMR